MDKISKIVPDTGRFKNVDMKKEKPIRSGAPNFGQPVAEATVRPGVGMTIDNVKETYGRIFGPDGEKAKERQQMQIVRGLTAQFFNQPIIEEPVDKVEISSPDEADEVVGVQVPVQDEGLDAPQAALPQQRSLDVRV